MAGDAFSGVNAMRAPKGNRKKRVTTRHPSPFYGKRDFDRKNLWCCVFGGELPLQVGESVRVRFWNVSPPHIPKLMTGGRT